MTNIPITFPWGSDTKDTPAVSVRTSPPRFLIMVCSLMKRDLTSVGKARPILIEANVRSCLGLQGTSTNVTVGMKGSATVTPRLLICSTAGRKSLDRYHSRQLLVFHLKNWYLEKEQAYASSFFTSTGVVLGT